MNRKALAANPVSPMWAVLNPLFIIEVVHAVK
jgi:cytochrome bd-type quinol oxidase subunit 1